MNIGKKEEISGVVVGIMTNNRDPVGIGRVKVRFPWRDESKESGWTRAVTLMAGKGRGTYFLPEVGDEVLISFDHGDIHHPYVIGALWNGEDTPPEANTDGKNNIRMIKSRSGHKIILNDTEGEEKLEIKTESGHSIVLDDTLGGEKIEIKDNKGNSIAIDSVLDKDGKPRYVLLGEGTVPIKKMLDMLVKGRYDGYATLEWEKRWHPKILEPEIAFPQYVQKMHEWLG